MENGLLEAIPSERNGGGFPELTALGKRIEMLRIERGLSKQALARGAATSRQQLWRVMTGKSELTSTLGQRLAEVLQIDARVLRGLEGASGPVRTWAASDPSMLTLSAATSPAAPASFAEFVTDPAHLERALETLPADADGLRLRRLLLEAVHEVATTAGVPLAPDFLALRSAVTAL